MGEELRIIRVEGRRDHEREEDFPRELGEFRPLVVLSDFSTPQFDGMGALRIARETAPMSLPSSSPMRSVRNPEAF